MNENDQNNANLSSSLISVEQANSYNLRSPAVKRILREAKELENSTYEYYARPLEDNIFEWHFTIRGASDSDFSDGYYHGRIILPKEYPMNPPTIILLTPNGRFKEGKKICLTISGYHPETWMPSWSIRTVLLAIISFMPTNSEGAIGSLNYTSEERRKLAKESHHWSCHQCGEIKKHLKSKPDHQGNKKTENIPSNLKQENEIPENLIKIVTTDSKNSSSDQISTQSHSQSSIESLNDDKQATNLSSFNDSTISSTGFGAVENRLGSENLKIISSHDRVQKPLISKNQQQQPANQPPLLTSSLSTTPVPLLTEPSSLNSNQAQLSSPLHSLSSTSQQQQPAEQVRSIFDGSTATIIFYSLLVMIFALLVRRLFSFIL